MLSTFSVASYARFQATLTTFSRAGVRIHLCSPTRNCALVLVSIENSGRPSGTMTLRLVPGVAKRRRAVRGEDVIDLADGVVLACRLDYFGAVERRRAGFLAVRLGVQHQIWTNRRVDVGAAARRPARHAADARKAPVLPKTFVATEEERLFAEQRPAEIATGLMPLERRLVGVGVVEVIPRVQRVIAEKPEGGTAEAVSARARHRGHDAAAAPAVLRAVVVDEDLELADGFNPEQATGRAARGAIPLKVHVGPIELIVDLVRPGTGHRHLRAHAAVDLTRSSRRCQHAGLQEGQLAEVAAVQWQLANLLGVDHRRDRRRRGIDHRGVAADRHDVLEATDANRHVQGQALADAEPDVGTPRRLEALQLD